MKVFVCNKAVIEGSYSNQQRSNSRFESSIQQRERENTETRIGQGKRQEDRQRRKRKKEREEDRRADPKGEFAAAVTCNQADGRHTTTHECACALTRRRTCAPSVYRPAQGCSLRLGQFWLCHGNFPLARNNTTTS